MSRNNQDCLEIFFTRLRSAGGDDDHPGAVGAMKRMIILEIGKNCETLVSNPAVQIEKEYDVYRIEDEEEKESVTKQITGDILDITIGEESCSEFEFTFDIPHEVHVDFAINHPLDQFKNGISTLRGSVIYRVLLPTR
uniref:Putative LOC100572537 [Acyrthosiphon pisum] n=1 Tax=Lepeophtheirus salmonis TaxID=72036 RepID=A0A0K2VJC7_LEPSM